MDLERIRIVGGELARQRDPRAHLPNAAEWASAVGIVEALERWEGDPGRPAPAPARASCGLDPAPVEAVR